MIRRNFLKILGMTSAGAVLPAFSVLFFRFPADFRFVLLAIFSLASAHSFQFLRVTFDLFGIFPVFLSNTVRVSFRVLSRPFPVIFLMVEVILMPVRSLLLFVLCVVFLRVCKARFSVFLIITAVFFPFRNNLFNRFSARLRRRNGIKLCIKIVLKRYVRRVYFGIRPAEFFKLRRGELRDTHDYPPFTSSLRPKSGAAAEKQGQQSGRRRIPMRMFFLP